MNNIQTECPKRFIRCYPTDLKCIKGEDWCVVNGKLYRIKFGEGELICLIHDYELVADENIVLADALIRRCVITVNNPAYSGSRNAKDLDFDWIGEKRTYKKGGALVTGGFEKYIEEGM